MLKGAVRAYQKTVGGLYPFKCPFYPSCSNYCRECLDRYGSVRGIMMTSDRLLRCHIRASSTKAYDIISENGAARLLDPPERNCIWTQHGEANPKSPAVGGLLSLFIPGAGQWYGGRKIDAVFAFSTVATFAAGTLVAKHNGEEGWAWTVGAVGGVFYLGNVYGGINAAHRYNEKYGDGDRPVVNVTFLGFSW